MKVIKIIKTQITTKTHVVHTESTATVLTTGRLYTKRYIFRDNDPERNIMIQKNKVPKTAPVVAGYWPAWNGLREGAQTQDYPTAVK